MKTYIYLTLQRPLFFAVLCASVCLPTLSRAAVALTINPSSVSNTYSGTITLQVSGITAGDTVVVQKFLDANSNGVIDGADSLVQQFNLTDGQASVIGGVTNLNVPGDTNTTAASPTRSRMRESTPLRRMLPAVLPFGMLQSRRGPAVDRLIELWLP